MVDLLERETIGAKAQPLAFITVDGLGDVLHQYPAGDSDISHLIILNHDQPRLLLAVLKPQVLC